MYRSDYLDPLQGGNKSRSTSTSHAYFPFCPGFLVLQIRHLDLVVGLLVIVVVIVTGVDPVIVSAHLVNDGVEKHLFTRGI